MSATASTPTRERRPGARADRRRARRRAEPTRGCRGSGPTLEDAILGALTEMAEAGRSTCPVCGSGELEPLGCDRCGSALT